MANTQQVPRDLEDEARRVTDPKQAELARRVAQMDPPSRAAAAVALAVEGAAYSDIARLLDYGSAAAAKKAVWNALGDAEVDAETVAHQRTLMGRGLGRLLSSCMKRATNPHDPDHLAYVRVVLAIYDRQARLYGLDAPSQLVVHSPTQAEIDAYVAQVRRLSVVDAGDVEADIIEGEVVDGADAQAS